MIWQRSCNIFNYILCTIAHVLAYQPTRANFIATSALGMLGVITPVEGTGYDAL